MLPQLLRIERPLPPPPFSSTFLSSLLCKVFIFRNLLTLTSGVPDATELCDGSGYKVARTAAFECPQCKWSPKGVYVFAENENAKGLRLSWFLRHHGYEIDGGLIKGACEEKYKLPLSKGGKPAGCLDVEFLDYDEEKDWLKARIAPSKQDAPSEWPCEHDTLMCYLQVSMREGEKTEVHEGYPAWKSKNMPAGVLPQPR